MRPCVTLQTVTIGIRERQEIFCEDFLESIEPIFAAQLALPSVETTARFAEAYAWFMGVPLPNTKVVGELLRGCQPVLRYGANCWGVAHPAT